MRKITTSLLLLFLGMGTCFAQKPDLVKIADSISNEGKVLFCSEWASWYGTDIFQAKCKSKNGQQAGYISYDAGSGLKNVFFSKDATPVVLATISFGYDFNPENYTLDTVSRNLTVGENDLYQIRRTAITRITNDTLFRFYKNTDINPVPIINNRAKMVYVLTGTSETGLVLFGNDYLITFNSDNSINSVKKLHNSLIPVDIKKDPSKVVVATVHTHLPQFGDFMTATDICTTMLYERFTTWNQSIVTGKDYVSIWDCHKNSLQILTREDWEKRNQLKSALESAKGQ